jgi:hypothetical protein
MRESDERKRKEIAERMKRYKQSPETIEACLRGESWSWDSTEEAMTAAAVIRMELMNLSSETIEAFEQRKEVRISNQVCIGKDPNGDESDEIRREGPYVSYKGMLFSLSSSEPTETQLQAFKDYSIYDYEFIYHIHRLEIQGIVTYTLFCVGEDVWHFDSEEQKITDGAPWVCAAFAGDENWRKIEYEKIFIKPVMGYVFRTDMPTYAEETLRFVESKDMKEFLRSRPDIMNRTNCVKIVTCAPASLESKIQVLELIAEQTEPDSEVEEYDPVTAAKIFRAALGERYENIPSGTVFLLRERSLNRYDSSFYNSDVGLFTEFDAAMEYITEELLPKLDDTWADKWDINHTWYEIIKYTAPEGIRSNTLHYDIRWALDAKGDIWYSYGNYYDPYFEAKFLLRKGVINENEFFELTTVGWDGFDSIWDRFRLCRNIIEIPMPFCPGDIVKINCEPFTEDMYTVITVNDEAGTRCVYIYKDAIYSSLLENVFGFEYRPHNVLVPTLYRAELVSWMPESTETDRLQAISAAIKANSEIGTEMEKYIEKIRSAGYYRDLSRGKTTWTSLRKKFKL